MSLHYERQSKLLIKLLWLRKLQKLNSFKLDDNIYNDISFNVIKRGPLLTLLIGLIFSCIIFISEIILIFSMNFG